MICGTERSFATWGIALRACLKWSLAAAISGPFKMVYSASTVARCRVVLHEPLYCACGKSFVEPPVVPVSAEHRLWNVHRACPCNLLQTEFCGTKPPECDEPCGQLQGLDLSFRKQRFCLVTRLTPSQDGVWSRLSSKVP